LIINHDNFPNPKDNQIYFKSISFPWPSILDNLVLELEKCVVGTIFKHCYWWETETEEANCSN